MSAKELRDRFFNIAVEAEHNSSLVNDASSRSLFAKSAAIEACKANPYQPAVIWHPTSFGSYMQLDLRERVGQEIFLTGAFEPDLLWFFTCTVQPGMKVFDCGAHIGFFTVAFAMLVGPEGYVDAFEPVGPTKIYLDTNIHNTGMSNIDAHPVAVWSKSEELTFYDWGVELSAFNGVRPPRVAPDVALPEPNILKVSAVSLDDFAQANGRYPDFVKIDVESAEDEVIQGMASLLTDKRPTIVLEVGDFGSAGGAQTKTTLKRLSENEYELFELKKFKLIPHIINETEPYGYGNLVALPKERVLSVLRGTGNTA